MVTAGWKVGMEERVRTRPTETEEPKQPIQGQAAGPGAPPPQ